MAGREPHPDDSPYRPWGPWHPDHPDYGKPGSPTKPPRLVKRKDKFKYDPRTSANA
tara:strand:+ start:1566 stop:1733 length:168 start_codon:yes stop_codon:yes gene_type:complete